MRPIESIYTASIFLAFTSYSALDSSPRLLGSDNHSRGSEATPVAIQAVVSWSPGAFNSDQLLKNGEVVRILVHDGVAVSASVIRTENLMWVNVSVTNRATRRVDVDPPTFSLDEIQPKQRPLAYRDPRALAKSITRRAEWGAALSLIAGDLARKETTTEVSSVGSSTTTGTSRTDATARNVYTGDEVNIAGRTSGRYTTTSRSNTTVRTSEPDEAARENAAIQANAITARAGMKADKVLAQALLANTLQPGEAVGGAVFFDRDKKAQVVRFRVPLNGTVFEIPLEIR
jgi:hypothetical protein